MSAPLPEDHFEPVDRAAWRGWLPEYCAIASGVRCVLHDKSAGPVNLSNAVAVQEAPCFGWSAADKARIERLESAGLLKVSGNTRTKAAERNGPWTHPDHVDALDAAPDLQAEKWTVSACGARRGFPERTGQARTAPRRAGRIEETASKAPQGERVSLWRRSS